MSDEFMQQAWRKPPPVFTKQLREQLRHLDEQRRRSARPRMALRAVACAASLLLAVCVFTFPSVRAGAQEFLDLFRVVNFVAVPVQKARFSALQQTLDLPRILGEQVHIIQASGPPQPVAGATEAGSLAGIRVRLPTWSPDDLAVQDMAVLGQQTWSVTASTRKLQQVLDAVGITDLPAPAGIDGQTARIVIHPSVRVTYSGKATHALFIQARQPEVSFPVGTDLSYLAEIGLRVLGFEPDEARRFAQNVDWRTTLLVPVPAGASNFRQVEIQGTTGLLIESAGTGGARQSQLLWSAGDSVFALIGNVHPEELFEMARSTP